MWLQPVKLSHPHQGASEHMVSLLCVSFQKTLTKQAEGFRHQTSLTSSIGD